MQPSFRQNFKYFFKYYNNISTVNAEFVFFFVDTDILISHNVKKCWPEKLSVKSSMHFTSWSFETSLYFSTLPRGIISSPE